VTARPSKAFRTLIGRCAAGLAGALILGVTSDARADVSSWLFLGGGASWLDQQGQTAETQPMFQLDTGLGSPPRHAIIVGGLGRLQTHFGSGTDLGLALRIATHGFVNGGWGVALDPGLYQRWWGEGSTGFNGMLALGAPWGVTLGLSASLGSDDARGFSGVIGIDLARLTIYRTSGTSYWKNTFPAYRPEER
jgi:hypothetical protein